MTFIGEEDLSPFVQVAAVVPGANKGCSVSLQGAVIWRGNGYPMGKGEILKTNPVREVEVMMWERREFWPPTPLTDDPGDVGDCSLLFVVAAPLLRRSEYPAAIIAIGGL